MGDDRRTRLWSIQERVATAGADDDLCFLWRECVTLEREVERLKAAADESQHPALRDRFAMAALPAIIAAADRIPAVPGESVDAKQIGAVSAVMAYAVADEMLRERETKR